MVVATTHACGYTHIASFALQRNAVTQSDKSVNRVATVPISAEPDFMRQITHLVDEVLAIPQVDDPPPTKEPVHHQPYCCSAVGMARLTLAQSYRQQSSRKQKDD